jgi:lactate permease
MPWTQRYDPLGSWPLSTLVSALPVLTLFFVLIVMKRRVWMSALSGMIVAIALAVAVFHMPAAMAAAACVHGFIFGVLRIGWIVVSSIFLYNIAVGLTKVSPNDITGNSTGKPPASSTPFFTASDNVSTICS